MRSGQAAQPRGRGAACEARLRIPASVHCSRPCLSNLPRPAPPTLLLPALPSGAPILGTAGVVKPFHSPLPALLICSPYSSTPGRTAKPFNPLLGETFEFVCPEKGFRCAGRGLCCQTYLPPDPGRLQARLQRAAFVPGPHGGGSSASMQQPGSGRAAGPLGPMPPCSTRGAHC